MFYFIRTHTQDAVHLDHTNEFTQNPFLTELNHLEFSLQLINPRKWGGYCLSWWLREGSFQIQMGREIKSAIQIFERAFQIFSHGSN